MIWVLNILCVTLIFIVIWLLVSLRAAEVKNEFFLGYILFLHHKLDIKSKTVFDFCYESMGDQLPKEIIDILAEEISLEKK